MAASSQFYKNKISIDRRLPIPAASLSLRRGPWGHAIVCVCPYLSSEVHVAASGHVTRSPGRTIGRVKPAIECVLMCSGDLAEHSLLKESSSSLNDER